MKEVLALFDFDGTFIKGNSLPRFLWHSTSFPVFMAKSFLLIPVFIKYIAGAIESHSAKEHIYMVFFAGTNKKIFKEKSMSFSRTVLPRMVSKDALIRLKWHQDRKHTCVIISASIEDYIIPWAEQMGISKVLATRLQYDDSGNITGHFYGKNCKGNEKVRRINECLGDIGNYKVYAYGDSKGDKEMLDIADFKYYKTFNKEKAYPGG